MARKEMWLTSIGWTDYLNNKSPKSLYNWLRRNHWPKDWACEALSYCVLNDNQTEDELYNYLKKNKTYMDLINEYKTDLVDCIVEEIEATW